jgi:hypothetical protein
VLCSPLLPGLTDHPSALTSVAVAAKAADASFFCAQPLFLKSCSKETYLGFVREHFPKLEAMYRERFDDAAFVSTSYAQRLRLMVRAVCRKHQLAERSSDALLTRELGTPDAEVPNQGVLFDNPVRRPVSAVRPVRRRLSA